jgi:hypothetical protein
VTLLGVRHAVDTILTDADIDRFADLTNLTEFDIARTTFSDAGLDRLSRLPLAGRVTVLRIGSPALTDAGMPHLARFRAVRELGLDMHGVSAGFAVLHQISELRRLRLHNCTMTPEAVGHLRGLKLERLSIEASGLTNATIARLPPAGPVVQLNLTHSADEVTGATLAAVRRGYPTVEQLSLHLSPLAPDALDEVARFPELKRAVLTRTKVTEAGVKRLAAACPQCKIEWDGGTIEPRPDNGRALAEWVFARNGEVQLEGRADFVRTLPAADPGRVTAVRLLIEVYPVSAADRAFFRPPDAWTDADLEAAAQTPAAGDVRFVAVSGKGVTDAGLDHLAAMKGLTRLYVNRTKVTPEGLKRFKAARPDVRVEADEGP